MKALYPVFAVIAALFTIQLIVSFDWRLKESEQQGFRGTGMVNTFTPYNAKQLAKVNQPPESFGPPEPGGELASEVYENIQILGHLTEDEFLGLMASITEWVAPEDQGCAYCHNEENLASDEVYAKNVSRRMIQMTWDINGNWKDHVQETGVTCYTCHRGQAVPEYGWYTETGPNQQTGGFSQHRNNQNVATEISVFTSLPYDALDRQLAANGRIRVQEQTALPISGNDGRASIQHTEVTYSTMMYMSDSLGVNCTFCHNSRAFSKWEESSPVRVTAWHGIQMVQDVNQEYVIPLAGDLPAEHLGPTGDPKKVGCKTCHQGIQKPLYGAQMLDDMPSLRAAPQ